MKRFAILGLSAAATSLVLVADHSAALAAPPACSDLKPPTKCAAPRDTNGYRAGAYQGESLVLQIWRSKAVDQNIDNWGVLKNQVVVTIPAIVASLRKTSWTQYTQCRVQGLLDGAVCKMNQLDPIPGCQLDGADWGRISGALYCSLSIDSGGLGDVKPWFVRTPPGVCGDKWQGYCDDVYRYSATEGADDLLCDTRDFLVKKGWNLAELPQPKCRPYTAPPFVQVFEDSVYIDCSYFIPSGP